MSAELLLLELPDIDLRAYAKCICMCSPSNSSGERVYVCLRHQAIAELERRAALSSGDATRPTGDRA